MLPNGGFWTAKLALLDHAPNPARIGSNVCPVFVIAIFAASSAFIANTDEWPIARGTFQTEIEDVERRML